MAIVNRCRDDLPSVTREAPVVFKPEEERAFKRWLSILKDESIPFALGGAFAVHAYTGIWRDTKD